MNVNVGGLKGWKKYPKSIQDKWHILDASDSVDVTHDLNSKKPFPLCDNVVSNYYASHVLEHVRMENQSFVFSELFRTLAPKGRIRIVVPNIEYGARMYAKLNPELSRNKKFPTIHPTAPPTPLGAFLSWLYTPDRPSSSGHCMGFDWMTLRHYLVAAGFTHEKRLEYNKCHPVFEGKDFSRYAGFCLFVEALKK